MASNPMFQAVPRHREADRFQWQQGHPVEPEERQIGVDPFSLRQLSRVDIDRPLPIPSVSVHDHNLPAYTPPRSASASEPGSPRLSSAAATPTRWDAHLALAHPATSSPGAETKAVLRSKSFADGEVELAQDEFDVVLSSSPERKASAPQRWGSDVPLIADARRRRGKHGTAGAAPFSCCLYLPGLTRRNRPTLPTGTGTGTAAAARSSSGSAPATFRGTEPAFVEPEPEPDRPSTARQSTMSLAVSLERFECRFSSRRSSSGLDLDDDDDEAAPSPSYFDLPLELIVGCEDDYGDGEAGLPMHAAFMFDSDGIRKSVLKNGVQRAAASAKVSGGSSGTDRAPARHHVRFSGTSGSAPADS